MPSGVDSKLERKLKLKSEDTEYGLERDEGC